MRSASSASGMAAEGGKLGFKVAGSSVLAGQDALLDQRGYQYVTDLIGRVARRSHIDAARDTRPDQFSTCSVDRKHVRLIIGAVLGLDVARAVGGTPIAIIARAPAESDSHI